MAESGGRWLVTAFSLKLAGHIFLAVETGPKPAEFSTSPNPGTQYSAVAVTWQIRLNYFRNIKV